MTIAGCAGHPPGLALVLFHDGGRIVRLHLHLAPRPPRGEED
ncbi:MAG: hypothetical protein P9F75_15490 [Candidatus Contendobacter sp.]|nr:hypothetical protein [Candidatus Contendobacter sp.]